MTGAVKGKALLSVEARLRQLMQARKQRETAWFVSTWRRSHLQLNNATWPPSNRRIAELAAANRLPPRVPKRMRSVPSSKQRRASKAALGDEDVSAGGRDDVAAEGNGDVAAVGDDDIIIVLLVHNRPAYLNRTLDALSKVDGIQHALLIVSHDGFYPPMHALVQSISFCRVKQLYFPFSPHLFNGTFPAASADDCRGKSRRPWETKAGGAERWEQRARTGGKLRKWHGRGMGNKGMVRDGGMRHAASNSLSKGEEVGEEEGGDEMPCWGQADEFGSYRDPRIVSLKVRACACAAVNTVWNGLPETRAFNGHMLFIEEDHWLFPNALSHLRSLLSAKCRGRCNECIAVSLAPADVGVVEDEEEGAVERRGVKTAVQAQREVEDRQRGVAGVRRLRLSVRRVEGNAVEKGGVLRRIGHFTAERLGNVGYSFNRSVWAMMHGLAQVGYVVPQVGYVVPQWGMLFLRCGMTPGYGMGNVGRARIGVCGWEVMQGLAGIWW
ncbi:unnamed protein product [Closterium sp. Naga37s-1]|nr:unnamed protein product [Closterium sp. Naga37s-1]